MNSLDRPPFRMPARTSRRLRPRSRPRLEPLEARIMLSQDPASIHETRKPSLRLPALATKLLPAIDVSAPSNARIETPSAKNRKPGVAIPVLVVPGASDESVTLSVTLSERRSFYRNEVGFFRVDDVSGRIGHLKPGDFGYAKAAMARRIVVFHRLQDAGATAQFQLPGGTLLGSYQIQNRSSARFLKNNPHEEHGRGGYAWFSFLAADPDHFSHIRLTAPGVLAMEDLTHGGDRDFNDDVLTYSFTVPPGTIVGHGSLPLKFGLDPASDTAPLGDDHTLERVVTLDGQTAPGARIVLAGLTVVAAADGSFQVPGVILTMGSNLFTATATDDFGHSSTISRTIYLDCGFASGLAGWTVHQDGGTAAGQGTVTTDGVDAVIHEGDSLDVTLARPVIIPGGSSALSFNVDGLGFDTSGTGTIKDAFEVALIDDQGRSLVPTFAAGRDSFYNATEGQPVALGSQTEVTGAMVTLNLSGVPAGTAGTLVFRLVNNDTDQGTTASVSCVVAPFGPTSAPAPSLGAGTAPVAALTTLAKPAAFDSQHLATGVLPASPTLPASGPGVVVDTPLPGASLVAGQTVLVSGRSTTGGAGRVVSVTVGGTQVSALDAAGDFFLPLVVAPGQSVLPVVATDLEGHSTSTSVTLNGTTRAPGEPDFSALADITASFRPLYARTSLDNGTADLYADISVANVGQYPAGSPLYVAVEHLKNPAVHTVNGSGVTTDGVPFYDLTGLVGNTTGALAPGAKTGSLSLAFFDPKGSPFTYDLVFLGAINRAPAFTTAPGVDASVGQAYHYAAHASDPDGDPLTYTLATGPAGMTIDPATGALTWTPQPSDAGNQDVSVRVADGRGGSAVERYTLAVTAAPPNRPPVFTSSPVVAAIVNAAYSYQATASDPDNDMLSFSVIAGPAGLTIDPTSGQVSWTPTEMQIPTDAVTLAVSDGHGGTATQVFSIVVAAEPGNHPPVITSTPVTTYQLLPPDQTPGGSIFLTGHDPDFHVQEGGNTAGARDLITTGIHFVTDTAFNTFAAAGVKKFLFVESTISPPGGHVLGVNGIIASGYTKGVDFDSSNASTLNAALDQLGTTYDAIVVASDFGAVLTQAELDILDARSNDIIKFLNAGGGLFAMAESDNGA